MTKLEMASELLPMVIALQMFGINIDMEINPKDIDIWHWHENGGIKRRFTITEQEVFDKAINYLKSL